MCSNPSGSRDRPRKNLRSANPRTGTSRSLGITPSDLNLLRALQEFIASADLPSHQVPSTRELARSGRQDLANAVRRRGYKAVAQLLANPNYINSSLDPVEAKPAPGDGTGFATQGHDVDASVDDAENLRGQTIDQGTVWNGSEVQQTTDLVPQYRTNHFVPHYESVAQPRANGSGLQKDHVTSEAPIEPAIFNPSIASDDNERPLYTNEGEELPESLLQKRAADFIRTGRFNSYEEGHSSRPEVSQVPGEFDNEIANDDNVYDYKDSSNDVDNGKFAPTQGAGRVSDSRESLALQNAAMSRSNFFDSPTDKGTAQQSREEVLMHNILAMQREVERYFHHPQQDKTSRAEMSRELEHVKALLHEKRMQNLELSRELEEAKAQLALVRAKVAAELAQAKQVAVEKDLRLQVAEQALQSLKRVQVDWWGKGNRVELAGSFNGWQHHLFLVPNLASEVPKADGSRGPMMWGVELWLYPGVYDVKFIIDGKWQLDHRREVVYRDMHENNLLRVKA